MTSFMPHSKVHLGAAGTKENMNKSLLSPTRINLAVSILTSSYVAVTLLGVPHQRVTEAGTRGSFPSQLALHCAYVCRARTLLSILQLSL